MWIRLDLSGTIFYFKVTGYVETTELDRFDKWCITDGCIENPKLHIDLQGEALLANEITSPRVQGRGPGRLKGVMGGAGGR